MLKNVAAALTILASFLATPSNAVADPLFLMQWTGPGGNGHWYGLVESFGTTGVRTWGTAEDNAELPITIGSWTGGGHLVTISDAAENAWLVGSFVNVMWPAGGRVIDRGAFIGLTQALTSANPASGWSWITGEPLSYVNWNTGEPNDRDAGIERNVENYGVIYLNGGPARPDGYWNDTNYAPTAQSSTNGYFKYGIAEYEPPQPVPEPGSIILFGSGLIGVSALARRKKKP
jgi:hypothetical protein